MSRHPLHLPRLLMRRSAAVVALTLLIALALGLHAATRDIHEEQEGALALTTALLRIQALSSLNDAQARTALEEIRQEHSSLRHLRVNVATADGQTLLALTGQDAAEEAGGPSEVTARLQDAVLAVHRRFFPMNPSEIIVRNLPRPDGSTWTLTLQASPESERLEALSGLLGELGLLCAMGLGLLLMLRVNLNHALRPVSTLLTGIDRLEQQDTHALRHLPTMPVLELEQIAAALRHLAESLEQAEHRRRVLAHQLSELQENERQRIASDLHDELGQHLTALRLDLSWLQRQLETAPSSAAATVHPLLGVTRGMTDHCRVLQRDLRNLLTRLRPFGHEAGPPDTGSDRIEIGALKELIQSLADSWATSDRDNAFGIDWQMQIDGAAGASLDPAHLSLDRSVALTLFRLSQEALTNVARHASAQSARLRLHLRVRPDPTARAGHPPALHADIEWSCEDDGVGLPTPDDPNRTQAVSHRGNGMASMHERVWLLGGRWQLARSPDLGGLKLSATLGEASLHAAPPDLQKAA